MEMTLATLNVKYWSYINDMVDVYNILHKSDVKPWECVRFSLQGKPFKEHPVFQDKDGEYTFAVGILYDEVEKKHKPVFVGDKLFNAVGVRTVVTEGMNISLLSWNETKKQKKNLSVNGYKLPAPEKVILPDVDYHYINIGGETFAYEDEDEYKLASDIIMCILKEVRDK